MAISDLSDIVRARKMELRGTMAICAVGAMIGVLFAGSTVVTPLYVIHKQQFGFSQISLTLIYAAYVLGNLAALLVFGRLSDQIGRRRTAVIAMAIAIASAAVFLLARGIGSLYAGRILSGLAIGIGAGTATAWLAELIAREDKSRATIIATTTNFLGLGIGALMSGMLAEYAPSPLRLPFIVYLVILVAVAVLVWSTRETVSHPATSTAQLRPRLSVRQPSERNLWRRP
jgi:MFS family permease